MTRFEDMEYLALEGGGGKGAVYKGAILALEELLYKEWIDGRVMKKQKTRLPVKATEAENKAFYAFYDATNGAFPKRDYPSLLEYCENDAETGKIKGISGSSAGAITAFALVLGLTSEDIGEILNEWQFSESFLPNNQLHEGKYRMMGMDCDGKAKFLIAEDHLKKLGEDRLTPYLFSGNQRIGNNAGKMILRNLVVTEGVNIILSGLFNRMAFIKDTLQKESFFGLVKGVKYVKNKIAAALGLLNIFNASGVQYMSRGILLQGKSFIPGLLKRAKIPVKTKILDLLPANHLVPAVGNIIWDRGIYAGFEIRDFFFKIVLMALSNDTPFKRNFMKNTELLQKLQLSKTDIETFFYKFGDGFDDPAYQASHSVFARLFRLPELLTFKALYEIIPVNFCTCVTNATTSQPLYFSHYFTPDFPVIEAVSASMGFPVAFKPVYNEANVLTCDIPYLRYNAHFQDTAAAKPVELFRLQAHQSKSGVYKEKFSIQHFKQYQAIVLKYIREKYSHLNFSVNGNLSFRSFLPWLRMLIAGNNFTSFTYTGNNSTVKTYDAANMKFLCCFFYNSAFKGLLIDGGATNNLPMSVFTFAAGVTEKDNGAITGEQRVQQMDVKKKVLALKLDNSFPQVLKDACFKMLENDKAGKLTALLYDVQEPNALLPFATRLIQSARASNAFRLTDKDTETNGLEGLPQAAKIKIAKELIEEYKLSASGFTPWNRRVFILTGLLNALSFGFDQGQIEDVDDNNNIIPLYCYGIGTLDFDLRADDMKPLVDLAVEESEAAVIRNFYPAK